MRFWQAAPAERICSHSGAAGFFTTREITAMTSGARKKRFASFSSRNAPGSFSSARQTSARTLPNSARASPWNRMKRQGTSFLWSGTREAARRISSSSAALGPGSARLLADTERRASRRSSVGLVIL